MYKRHAEPRVRGGYDGRIEERRPSLDALQAGALECIGEAAASNGLTLNSELAGMFDVTAKSARGDGDWSLMAGATRSIMGRSRSPAWSRSSSTAAVRSPMDGETISRLRGRAKA